MAKGPGFEPIGAIRPKRPLPSILTASTEMRGSAWRSGVTWRSAGCVPGYAREFCSTDELEAAAALVKPQFYPYTLYLPATCDWVLPDESEDYRADARDQLDAVTPWHVSRELMLGGIENENPSLVSEAVDVSAAAGPVHPVTALGTLLEAYFDCNAGGDPPTGLGRGTGTPVVHAPLSIVTSLLAHGVIARTGDYYVGPNCVVSPGPGYPTGALSVPDDGADGDEDAWVYISGPVEYGLGEIIVHDDDFDHRTNEYHALAQRLAIHRFDPCCVFAVAVYQPSPTDSANV